MFSRRHPFLFFILIFTAIIAAAIISLTFLLKLEGNKSNFAGIGQEKVGVIEIVGVISDTKNILLKLKRFSKDDSIKAIVIRIDSPGGSVGSAQEVSREIKRTTKFKKIVASLGTVAASGGYYIAAGADGIVANPGTITGSIGVVMGLTNYQELLNKIGLVSVVIKSCEYKDIGSPVRKMTEKESAILQGFVHNIHMQFVTAIAEGRKMDRVKVESIADGRIFSGEEAKELGLVDRLGNLEDAIEWAGRMGGIKGEITTVYPKEKKFPVLKYIIDSSLNEILNRALN